MAYLSELTDKKILIRLHVQPKASKSRVVGFHDGCLKIAVAAPPVEGKANKAVVGLLADLLGVAGRDVEVIAGALSRKKQVVVHGLNAAVVRQLIEEAMAQR